MRLLVAVLLLALPLLSFAHGVVHGQIEDLDHRISHQPENAELYIKRGRLYQELGHNDDAARDFQAALRLDVKARAVHYHLAELALKRNATNEALKHIETFITSLDGEAGGMMRGHRLLGYIHQARNNYAAAARAFEVAIGHAESPPPEFYLELADAHAKRGLDGQQDALSALDAGIARLGPLAVLQDRAIEYAIQAARYEDALRRLDALIEHKQRLPELYLRRGSLLQRMGHQDVAIESFRLALQHIDQLPLARQKAAANTLLRERIVAQLGTPP